MKHRLIILILMLICCLGLAGQEARTFDYLGQYTIYVLLPYDLFFFSAETGQAVYQLSINLSNQDTHEVNQFTDYINLSQDSVKAGSTLAMAIAGQYKPGKYQMVTLLENAKLGDRKEKHFSLDLTGLINQKLNPLIIAANKSYTYTVSAYEELTPDLKSCILIFNEPSRCDSLTLNLTRDGNIQSIMLPSDHTNKIELLPWLGKGALAGLELLCYTNQGIESSGDLLYKVTAGFSSKYSYPDQLLQIKYIAKQNEWRSLRKMGQKDARRAVEYYWEMHNNATSSDKNDWQQTFQDRVLKADELFTIHKQFPGWKSDRGRIYIMRGAPDDIVEETFPLGRNSYILWYYFKDNLVYRFVDKTGFGNYRLEGEYYEN